MASIDSITFSITRTSYPTGHICSIDYSYALRFTDQEIERNLNYNISVALYGDDLLRDKHIGEPAYDAHIVSINEPMPIKRSFAVSCDILDEAIGEDKVFMKIFAVSSAGDVVSAKSETIKDWF